MAILTIFANILKGMRILYRELLVPLSLALRFLRQQFPKQLEFALGISGWEKKKARSLMTARDGACLSERHFTHF